jgi:hypothetical protein
MEHTTKIVKLLALLFVLVFTYSCNDNDNEEETYTAVPTSNYALSDFCAWDDLPVDDVIIINSREELEAHTDCEEEEEPYDIDFSSYSLVLASGSVIGSINSFSATLLKSTHDYLLEINVISIGDDVVGTKWIVAYVTPKISSDSKIELAVTSKSH